MTAPARAAPAGAGAADHGRVRASAFRRGEPLVCAATLKLRSLQPRGIAAQLILLVALSALIFHLCMNGAFLLNRAGWFRPLHPNSVTRLDHAVEVVRAARPDDRGAVLRAVVQADPELELRLVPAGAPVPRGRQSLDLGDGTALSAASDAPRHRGPDPALIAFATLTFVGLSTTLFLVWAVRGVTAPLRRVSEAVEGFALDGATLHDPRPLPESGPAELEVLARGFNGMQARIARMMRERTGMLAAVSHDLRTPITRLRLRAEYVADAPLRELMLRDLHQMDALVHSALSFIRDGRVERAPARLDLASLLRTVCDEAADMGHRARYCGPDRLVVTGHEDELRRAVGNLVDNAARVEAEAVVELARGPDGMVSVTVTDDGPGIPPDRLEEVMEPFRRGAEDGARGGPSGFGLGLPIVQAIVQAHGGTLTLSNREPHGLRCRIALPAT